MLYVTHDQVTAMTTGHPVPVLRDGDLKVDAPKRLYNAPIDTFVASFIGAPAITRVEARVLEGSARVRGIPLVLERSSASKAGERVVVGLRQESWHTADWGRTARSLATSGSSSPLEQRRSATDGRRTAAATSIGSPFGSTSAPAQCGDAVLVLPNSAEADGCDAATGDRIGA